MDDAGLKALPFTPIPNSPEDVFAQRMHFLNQNAQQQQIAARTEVPQLGMAELINRIIHGNL